MEVSGGNDVIELDGVTVSCRELGSVAACSGYQGGNGVPFGVVGIGGGVRLRRKL